MKLLNSLQTGKFVPAIFLVLVFLGALLWAKRQDPFSRQWFTLKTAGHDSFKCVAVLPKPVRKCPVVIYAHGAGGTLMNDGNDLRQMAELGLAVVSWEYNQDNQAVFSDEFKSLLNYLGRQNWADTNAVCWVGFSLGANRMLDFARTHPKLLPQLLIQLGGRGADQSTPDSLLLAASNQRNVGSTNSKCSILLVHGEADEVFPWTNTWKLASILKANGLPVKLEIIPGLPHGMEPERGPVFRSFAECCRTHLLGEGAWRNYHSIAQWQAEAPPLWWFFLPALIWMVGGLLIWLHHRSNRLIKKTRLDRGEMVLRWLAAILASWAIAECTIRMMLPQFPVSSKSLSFANHFLIQSKSQADFDFLAGQPIWHEQKLKTLLSHVELAGYNRKLINWQVDDNIYRDYVLSPAITGRPDEQLNWRRSLWEEFYPRIRHETVLEDAAQAVMRHLRERVTIATLSNPSHEVPDIWLRQITDEAGFEIIYVAALRSVGIPAHLATNGRALCWDGSKWQNAPEHIVFHW